MIFSTIVTGGGLSTDGRRWVNLPYRKKFLFPARAVSKRVRRDFAKLLRKAYREDTMPGKKNKKRRPRHYSKRQQQDASSENILPPAGMTWMEGDGLHALLPGKKPSAEQIQKITENYQRQIRETPLFKQWLSNMVSQGHLKIQIFPIWAIQVHNSLVL